MKHINSFLSILCLTFISSTAFGQVGTLDTEFNGTGYFSYDFGNNDIFQDVTVQPDQKIVCTGVRLTSAFTGELIVMRLNPDGTLDTSFSGDGIFSFLIGQETYGVQTAITADGKILVAGIEYVQDYTADFMVLRLNDDGTLDTSFGTDGYSLVDIGGVDQFTQAMTLQDDGKILISGTSVDTETIDNNNAPTILRLTADGQVDQTFGMNGFVMIPTVFIDNELTTVKVQPDGKIVAAGHFEQAFDGSSDFDILVIRTDEDGILDPDFGDNGVVIQAIDLGVDDCFGMDFDDDGNIYTGGFTSVAFTGDLNMVLLKFLPDGTLDTSFGVNGIVQDTSDPFNAADDLLVQPDQKILLGGAVGSIFAGSQSYALWRFLPTGEPDPAFGTNGLITTDVTGQVQDCTALALQADGKILAAGRANFSSNRDMIVMRFENDIVSGLNDLESEESLMIHPNPVQSSGSIYLQFDQPLSSRAFIEILDISGRLIQAYPAQGLAQTQDAMIAIQLSENIQSGMYLVRLTDEGMSVTERLRVD